MWLVDLLTRNFFNVSLPHFNKLISFPFSLIIGVRLSFPPFYTFSINHIYYISTSDVARRSNIADKCDFNINEMQIVPRFNTGSKHKGHIFPRSVTIGEDFLCYRGPCRFGWKRELRRRSVRHVNNPAMCTGCCINTLVNTIGFYRGFVATDLWQVPAIYSPIRLFFKPP